MIENQIERAGGIPGTRRWRYLVDIVALVAVTFLLDVVAGAFIRAPTSLQRELFVFDAMGKMLLVGVAWGLIRLRGERLADIGLKRPVSWMRTFMIGVGFAAIIFIAMYLSEKAGFRRDLSRFKDVQGNLELTLFAVFYALSGRAFTKNSCSADSLCKAWPCSSVQAAARGSSHVSCKARFSGQHTLTRILSGSRLPAR